MSGLVDLASIMIPIVGSVVLFAFLSVVGWALQKRKEREAFYRYDVLKKLVEQGGAGGQQAMEMIRTEAQMQERRRREAQILGGLIAAVIGGSTMILLYILVPGISVWTAGLIPFAVGAVIVLFALLMPRMRAT